MEVEGEDEKRLWNDLGGWNLSFRVLIPISFRWPFSGDHFLPAASHPAGYNISSRIPYRLRMDVLVSLWGTTVFTWKIKELKILWDGILASSPRVSWVFHSPYVAAVSGSVSHCLAWAVWGLHAQLPQADSKVLEGRAALFSASSIAASRRCSHPQDGDTGVPDTGQVPSHCLCHPSTPELPDAEPRVYFHCVMDFLSQCPAGQDWGWRRGKWMREEIWLESWLLGSWIQVLCVVGMCACAYVSISICMGVYISQDVFPVLFIFLY